MQGIYHRVFVRLFLFSMHACILSIFSRVQFCKSMDCSLLGSSVHGILQVRILEWVPFLPAEDLSDSGTELSPLCLPHCRMFLYLLSHWGNPGGSYEAYLKHLTSFILTTSIAYKTSTLLLSPLYVYNITICLFLYCVFINNLY